MAILIKLTAFISKLVGALGIVVGFISNYAFVISILIGFKSGNECATGYFFALLSR